MCTRADVHMQALLTVTQCYRQITDNDNLDAIQPLHRVQLVTTVKTTAIGRAHVMANHRGTPRTDTIAVSPTIHTMA